MTDLTLLSLIDEQRLRLGMSVVMPIRIGYHRGLVWVALSRHPDHPLTEGSCSGETLSEALGVMLAKLTRRDVATT